MGVLVTGATGWLGLRLVESLKDFGVKNIVALVMPGENDIVLRNFGVKVVVADIRNHMSLKGVCDGVDTVFHCAGIIHPRFIKDLYDINVLGTNNVLNAAIDCSVKKFIFISSNSVAGVNSSCERLFTEADRPCPYMNYGISKLKAESLVNQAYNDGKINTTIIRPCWFYGPRQPDRQTFFFRMIKKGNPIIFGDGDNLRSLSYVDNTIGALLLICDSSVVNGKTYWITDKRPYSTIEIYGAIAKLLKVKNFKPRFVPNFISSACVHADKLIQSVGVYVKEIHVAGEMNKNIACSIDNAQNDFGYDPKVELEEGMLRSLEWCRSNNVEI